MNFEKKIQSDNAKYAAAFKEYGCSPKSLLIQTDRRNIRYYELLKHFQLSVDATLLDVGCGFADLFRFCRDYFGVTLQYTGIDYCYEFIETIEKTFPDSCTFVRRDFLSSTCLKKYDYCVLSGIFNLSNGESKETDRSFMQSVVNKMFELCNIAISFNFVTDKVDYKKTSVAYHSPAKTLDFCYGLSRNIVFDNSCMPFEATVTIFKDDSYNKSRVFHAFEQKHRKEFEEQVFTANELESHANKCNSVIENF